MLNKLDNSWTSAPSFGGPLRVCPNGRTPKETDPKRQRLEGGNPSGRRPKGL
jgi:hypothetical protein